MSDAIILTLSIIGGSVVFSFIFWLIGVFVVNTFGGEV